MSEQPERPQPSRPPAGVDELASAKARLLELGEEAPEKLQLEFIREHPYLVSGIALAAGLVCGRVPMLRKATITAAMWAGKRALARHLQDMARGR